MEVAPLQLALLYLIGAGWLLSIGLLRLPWRYVRYYERLPLRLSAAEMFGLVLVWILAQVAGQNLAAVLYGHDVFAIDHGSIRDWSGFGERVRDDADGPGARIRELLSEQTKAALAKPGIPFEHDEEFQRLFIVDLNRMLGSTDFYERDRFEGVPFQPRELLEQRAETLDGRQLLQLNRLLLEASFPGQFAAAMQRYFTVLAIVITAVAAALLTITRFTLRAPLRHLGLFRPGAGLFAAYGVCQAVFWGPITMLCIGVLRYLDPPDVFHVAQNFFAVPQSPFGWSLLVYNVVVLAPLVEEILFRGMMQGWISRRFPAWVAIGVSAAFFGAAHLNFGNPSSNWPDAVALTLLGIGLGITYQRTRSLWSCIAFHAAFNAFNLAIGAAG